MDMASRFSNDNGNGAWNDNGHANGDGHTHPPLNESGVQEALRQGSGGANGDVCSTDQATCGGARTSERETTKESEPKDEAQTKETQRHSWHDEKGRFKKGNPGGPGNPYNRAVAALKRQTMAYMLEGERMDKWIAVLYEKALQGNMAASRILQAMVVPAQVDPDRVDLHEWQLTKEESTIYPEIRPVLQMPDPEYLLGLLREARPRQTQQFETRVTGLRRMGPEAFQELKTMPQTEAVSIMNEVGSATPKGEKWLKAQQRAQRRRAKRRKR